MSANNQTLIKHHEGKFYVFGDVMAESWCDENGEHENELNLTEMRGVFDNRDDAFEFALHIDNDPEFGPTEYGVQFNRLCKDDAEVKLIPPPSNLGSDI